MADSDVPEGERGCGLAGDGPAVPGDDGQSTSWTLALVDHEAIIAAAGGSAGTAAVPLAALRLLDGLRCHLDGVERTLIEMARERDASWSQISTALGFGSRQAAEQRWRRLRGRVTGERPHAPPSPDRRQRAVDEIYGPEIGPLRAAVRIAERQLRADPGWDARHPRAVLVRRTLSFAAPAAPSALFSLARQAVEDLELVPTTDVTPGVESALGRLRRALAAARPSAGGPAGGDGAA